MSNSLMIPLVVVLFIVFGGGLWLGVTFVLSRVGGWHTLGHHFAAAGPPPAARRSWRSAMFGIVSYRFCVSFVAEERGLWVTIARPFRIFHPDLFIPWSALSLRETRWLLFPRAARLTFPSVPSVTVTVLSGEELLAAAPPSSLLPKTA